MIRLFAALAVPAEIAQALAPLQTGIEGARWRPPEALHVTLRFFGGVAEPAADDLDEALSEVTGDPFEVRLAGAGAFGHGRDIRAIWVGVEENALLRQLAGRCERAARQAGLAPDGRKYTPHLTLAYLRGADEDQVGAWIIGANLFSSAPITIDRFGLYSSWTGQSGSAYRLERAYRLD